jgi:hypothetical protein
VTRKTLHQTTATVSNRAGRELPELFATVRHISVSIVSGYGLDDQAIKVRSPAEARGFVL